MLDPKEREEMEEVLLHYGIKGMKWDKEKRKLKEVTRRKSDNVIDMRGKEATAKNIAREELLNKMRKKLNRTRTKKQTKSSSFDKTLEKAARKQLEDKKRKRKQHVDIANTMRDYAKTKEVKKKNDSFVTKVKDKVTGKKLDNLGKYMEQRFKGKDTERRKMIAKMVNEKRNPWEKKKKKRKK